MAKKSKRGSGPRPGSTRADRVAARKARQAAAAAPTARPFAGLRSECDLVAMRAFVASATAIAPLADSVSDSEVIIATVLPGAVPASVRADPAGVVRMAALQTEPEPSDIATSLAAAISWASAASPDDEFTKSDGPALAEVLDPDATLTVDVHANFNWWFDEKGGIPAELAAAVERAKDAIMPTARLEIDAPGAPWWIDAGDRAHIRWVRPEDEDALMIALARVHAAGALTLGEGSRFAGSFRTHGLLVPVFDLDIEMHHEEWVSGCVDFNQALLEALADDSELTAAQRSSRDGIRGRQVTLR